MTNGPEYFSSAGMLPFGEGDSSHSIVGLQADLEASGADMKSSIPELEGMKAAGITEDEIRRVGSKPTGIAFLIERFDDVDTLADPVLQESIRQMREKPETLTDITPTEP